jgi:predicted transcriptional regulator
MARRVSENLTDVQIEFMKALCRAIIGRKGPVSVDDIKKELGKSNSRVRSHVKALIGKGMIRCVGKSRAKKYSPSMGGLEAISYDTFEDPDYDELETFCIAGVCMTSGCGQNAEAFWRGGYYCRECIIGKNDSADMADIRKWHELTWGTPSGAGAALEMAYSEDISGENEISIDSSDD